MSRYLIVAHQTAESPELVRRIEELISDDAGAEFVLLVPATLVEHLLTWTEGESVALAKRRAEAARGRLESAGAKMIDARVGNASPLLAIADELRERPGYYDAVVICTFPVGLSRWLKLDLPTEAKRKFKLPVVHVVAKQPASTEAQLLKRAT